MTNIMASQLNEKMNRDKTGKDDGMDEVDSRYDL